MTAAACGPTPRTDGPGAPCPTGEPAQRFARVVVDIPTRALDRAFDYTVPPELAEACRTGACVLVDFAHRPAVGYVLGVHADPPADLDPAKVRPVRQVLAAPLFDEAGASAIEWIAREYACPLSQAARLFCPPGWVATTVKDPQSGTWHLRQERTGEVDDRWVSLTEQGRSYVPPANAARQRMLLEALSEGPVRQTELGWAMSGAAAVVRALEKRGVVAVERRRRVRGAATGDAQSPTLSSARAPRRSLEELTGGQRAALDAIEAARARAAGDVVLLDGVTGSGKTEVYLAAIERTLADGRDAVVLVPEISLTPQTVGRFRARFGDAVAVLHSRLSVGERFDQWDMARTGAARVVVGARSALFAPLRNPGLYVIDEEHEGSYKQGSAPRYHAREVAAEMARLHGAALVLGSATPSLEALVRCEQGGFRQARWARVEMPERAGAGTLPPVEVVDMGEEFASGWRSMFSRALTQALREVVERGEKAVLMLNQRGFARWMLCRDCGYVPRCEHCSTSLTYHDRPRKLVCHTCGAEYPVPTVCPECGSHYFKMSGMGTQQVEDRLRVQLDEIVAGGVPIVRMDADTTRAKGGHERCLEEFDAAPSAILLGTQMIAKGLDFPEVTLVGVVNADTVLKVCDFRAAERTYDLLEQVAGRAGRGERAGRVVIQTYQADHPAIQAAAHHDRSIFLDAELPQRAEALYPPFCRLANVVVWGAAEHAVRQAAVQVGDAVRAALAAGVPTGGGVAGRRPGAAGRGRGALASEDDVAWFARISGAAGPVAGSAPQGGAEVLGPVECVISRVQDRFRWHVLVKATPDAELGPLLAGALNPLQLPRGVSLAIDVDPTDLM